jgi:hypothetical protein
MYTYVVIYYTVKYGGNMKKKVKPGYITNNYRKLVESIGGIYRDGKKAAYQAIDTAMVLTYWNIGGR